MPVFHQASTFEFIFLKIQSELLTALFDQVYKRLKLTLELVKKEMEISKIQVSDVFGVFLFLGERWGGWVKFWCCLNFTFNLFLWVVLRNLLQKQLKRR